MKTLSSVTLYIEERKLWNLLNNIQRYSMGCNNLSKKISQCEE